jgi:glycine reductase
LEAPFAAARFFLGNSLARFAAFCISSHMHLELADFPVSQLRLAQSFRYDAGMLTVAPDELADLVRRDHRIEDISFAVVHPGDRVRITGIRDFVEPRVKVSGPGQVFPGDADSCGTCGRRMPGCANR